MADARKNAVFMDWFTTFKHIRFHFPNAKEDVWVQELNNHPAVCSLDPCLYCNVLNCDKHCPLHMYSNMRHPCGCMHFPV